MMIAAWIAWVMLALACVVFGVWPVMVTLGIMFCASVALMAIWTRIP